MLLDQTQGTEMERLWNLLGELSSQLSHNRQQTEELHRRADELRSQAVHSQTGFTLRRFNIDVDKEEFDSELERLNVSLVMENQALQSENRQLSSLLKDYESTLDAVMSKFRSYAHASQQHHLEITRHYENLLLSMPVTLPEPPQGSDPDSAPPIDPLHLQLSLSHLSSLIRKALRSLQGEDPEDSTSPLLHPIGNVSPFDQLKDSFDSLSISSSTTTNTSSRARSSSFSSDISLPSTAPSLAEQSHALLLASHHPQTTRNPPHDPSSGGYISKNATSNPLYIPTTSTSSLVASPPKPGQKEVEKDEAKSRGLGPLDEALMREVEVEALRRENEELKKLLRISEDDIEEEDRGRGEPFVGRKLFEHKEGAEQGEEDEEDGLDEKDEDGDEDDDRDVFNEDVKSGGGGGGKKEESSLKVEDLLKI